MARQVDPMRRGALSLIAMVAALVAASPAAAGSYSAGAKGVATATVVEAASVRGISALDFGSVGIPSSGQRAATVMTGAPVSSGGGQSARFVISIETGRHYALAIPRQLDLAAPLQTGTSAQAPLAARLRIAPVAGGVSGHGPLSEQLFSVGGRLEVGAGVTPGRYTGAMPVTIVFE